MMLLSQQSKVFKLRGRIGEGRDAMRQSIANHHFLWESVPESLATLVLPHSIITTQDPFAILHSLPQFTALVLLGYSYVGKHLAKYSADSFPKLQILHRRWRIGDYVRAHECSMLIDINIVLEGLSS
ncbi:uncharacterized protein LOC110008378 [Amborella trichopoda]|uniref:uncharacterized protein LOC110008378 n=1 Tax=Amborella trichopoda TaxID=13333 RepID=UPI0009C0689E|nr:uncharacterized protein LOC110008378 [Amborella trichopoda]|eukprot:XP_020530954.1 uncharacterized protein LOC110008378 [Amborella trichopoda]